MRLSLTWDMGLGFSVEESLGWAGLVNMDKVPELSTRMKKVLIRSRFLSLIGLCVSVLLRDCFLLVSSSTLSTNGMQTFGRSVWNSVSHAISS